MDGNFISARASSSVPIDHTHLARYTLGNRPLEVEVLQLFAGQAPLTLADLVAAHCAKSWHIAAHTLKGSARAVGAWGVAQAAEQAERAGHDSAQRDRLLTQLSDRLAEANTYINQLAQAA